MLSSHDVMADTELWSFEAPFYDVLISSVSCLGHVPFCCSPTFLNFRAIAVNSLLFRPILNDQDFPQDLPRRLFCFTFRLWLVHWGFKFLPEKLALGVHLCVFIMRCCALSHVVSCVYFYFYLFFAQAKFGLFPLAPFYVLLVMFICLPFPLSFPWQTKFCSLSQCYALISMTLEEPWYYSARLVRELGL